MAYQYKIGLKLYSTDTDLISDAAKLLKEALFDYIELYIIPGSYEKTISTWKSLDSPFVIHAPHSFHNVNLAQAEKRETNLLHFRETQKFANTMNSDIIIVHGGNNGSLDEMINQLAMLDDDRIALENKPKIGIDDEICVGWSPGEFQKAADAGVLSGMALDFVHAVCAANSSGVDVMDMIREFMVFKPKVFHLSDGNAYSEKDNHFNLGSGNLDLLRFLSLVPEGGLLTIETPHDPLNELQQFIDDVSVLKKLTFA